ncbi:MAG: type II secretion system F family protein [Selenomonadaceae bacterium]|nr:type II secretion system F family protein [Selenomonadaceae bacterium]MDY2685930.1 type II secretion system F family protein [Selenomonadaceae bacterium]
MLVLRLLFALSGACFVFLLLRYLIHQKIAPNDQLRARLNNIRTMHHRPNEVRIFPSGQNTKRQLKDIPFVERVVLPLEDYFSQLANQMTPKEWREWLQHKIVLAGKTQEIKPETLFGTMLLSAVLVFLMVWYYTAMQGTDALKMGLFLFFGSIAGGYVPIAVLNANIQKRKNMIMRQLPEVLDLLCVSVQAGLSFDAALRKITDRMKGPLIDEFKHFQDDVRMGMIRRNAMKHLAARCELQDVSLFMTALIQAEKLGSSMGKTLKNQADNIRERRRQYIKAEAMRAPIKILFPLVLFIFPAIFVVTLVPSLLALMKTM